MFESLQSVWEAHFAGALMSPTMVNDGEEQRREDEGNDGLFVTPAMSQKPLHLILRLQVSEALEV